MSEEKFVLKRGNCTIAGNIYGIPEPGEKRKAVILSHGFNGNQKETQPYALYLASNGFCTITYDFYGGNHNGESGGSLYDMTIESEKADLLAVIDYVRNLPYIDFSELTLMGCSQGAVISALVASEHYDFINNLVLIYPALCIPDDAKKGRMLLFKFDPQNIPDKISSLGLHLNGEYVRQALALDINKVIAGFPGRRLLIYGEKDKVVPASYMKKLIDTCNGSIESMVLAKGQHGLKKECLQSACKRTLLFLQHAKEFMQVEVLVKKVKVKCKGDTITADLYFDANASGDLFTGKSLSGARDRQIRKKFKPIEFTADYTLEGEDLNNDRCRIHVINKNIGNGWVPEITTDSSSLDFLNHAKCYAVEDHWKNGLTVHFFKNT